ncbi:uncharacterized protein LOC122028179 [Zingiber officinale]|uniref:uncharacterized protein LOC122028179 n=1 Tax=Zingiber officinale TaxID=94328 RepID=UPI001C4A8235|nr:uncharacterized protein LOC122028179 [Zingiber officinale]
MLSRVLGFSLRGVCTAIDTNGDSILHTTLRGSAHFSEPFEAVMAAFQLARPGFSLALRLRRSFPPHRRSSAVFLRCRMQEDGGESKGDVQPESLFMKELKRRGLDPATLLEEGDGGASIGPLESKEESSGGEGNGGSTKRNGVASAELEKKLSDQRELSMSLNSEGLEGLIPRAKVLLTIGGTFFLGFGPVILVIFALFLALYIYLGPSFVHDASSRAPVSSPPHVDPYALLEEESLSQVAPNLY